MCIRDSSNSIYYLRPSFFSIPPSRTSDPGSHSRLFSLPTHYGSCLAFLSREDFSSFSPRRLASNCAYPQQLIIFSFFFGNKLKISPRRDSNSWANTSSIRWLPLLIVHRGDRTGINQFYKKLKNVSCEYNRLNGRNSTLQAARCIRRVRIIWFLWTKITIWLLY